MPRQSPLHRPFEPQKQRQLHGSFRSHRSCQLPDHYSPMWFLPQVISCVPCASVDTQVTATQAAAVAQVKPLARTQRPRRRTASRRCPDPPGDGRRSRAFYEPHVFLCTHHMTLSVSVSGACTLLQRFTPLHRHPRLGQTPNAFLPNVILFILSTFQRKFEPSVSVSLASQFKTL